MKKCELRDGLFERIYNYMNNLKLANSKNDLLKLLFNEPESTESYTSASHGKEFKADVIHADLVPKLKTEVSKKTMLSPSDELIEYYKTTLFFNMKQKTNGNFHDWFLLLKEGISLYNDDTYRDELANFCRTNKIKMGGAKKHNGSTATVQLLNYFKIIINSQKDNPCDEDVFACSLFSCLYYLEYGCLPTKFSEQINGVHKDRQEFINEVIMKYGCSGNPGKHKIYKLANRENPNSIALYEAGELEYYGKGFNPSPDYQNAYNYYIKAVEASNYNALAGWALGYMLYNYSNEKDPLCHAKVKELENLTFTKRVIEATKILKKSFECGCPAAANVLGRILTDASIEDGIIDLLTSTYHLKSGIEYFKIASNSGYTFAKNNLYAYYKKRSTSDGDADFETAFCYLKESADLGDPYAMNKYANDYLVEYKKDRVSALTYFDEAATLSEDWAAWNILQYYTIDEDGVVLIKKLKKINNEQSKFDSYIARLECICIMSKNADVKNNYEKWKKD